MYNYLMAGVKWDYFSICTGENIISGYESARYFEGVTSCSEFVKVIYFVRQAEKFEKEQLHYLLEKFDFIIKHSRYERKGKIGLRSEIIWQCLFYNHIPYWHIRGHYAPKTAQK